MGNIAAPRKFFDFGVVTPLGTDFIPIKRGDSNFQALISALPSSSPVISPAQFNIPNLTPQVLEVISLAAGDNDIFTVPANKRAFVQLAGLFNTTGAPIIAFGEIKIAGVYSRCGPNITPAAGAGAQAGTWVGVIFEAGETISINTAAIGLNLTIQIYTYPNTFPLKNARALALAAQGTVYTAPAGGARLVGSLFQAGSVAQWGQYFANGIALVTISANFVPNAGAVGSGNQIYAAGGVAVGAQGAFNQGQPFLAVGDFISVTPSSSVNIFIPVYEG